MMECSKCLNVYVDSVLKNDLIKINNQSVIIKDDKEIDENLIEEKKENNEINFKNQTRQKLFYLKNENSSLLVYPFDCLVDYSISIYQIIDIKEEKKNFIEKIEQVKILFKNNFSF